MSTPRVKVLVVDDDPQVLKAHGELLRREGYDVQALSDPLAALAVTKDESLDVVVSDIKMPNLSGIELLKAFKQAQPDVEVIIVTAFAEVQTALEAVRGGAYDYLTKPFERIEDFTHKVAMAAERRTLKRRAQQLESELATRARFEGIVGQSAPMTALFKLVETVGPTDATVLIQGESGTGKELVARALHFRSPRKNRPFLAVNCSALTDTLLESELFGHMKGSFTGAVADRKGLFEAASGGTIFLDEIGDAPLSTQVRLLRVLQEGEIKRVGGTTSISVDVRVIAATNVDLKAARAEGRFRDDLFYRLNVINLELPPLRDRPQDIPLLAQHFLQTYGQKMGKKVTRISPAALKLLTLGRWAGNVRELENAMERAVVLCQTEAIEPQDLPQDLKEPAKTGGDAEFQNLAQLPFAEAKALTVRGFERRYLTMLLERTNANITQAALAAGMDRSNFRRLLKEHDLAGKGGAE